MSEIANIKFANITKKKKIFVFYFTESERRAKIVEKGNLSMKVDV